MQQHDLIQSIKTISYLLNRDTMKGFELEYNDQKISVGINNGVTCVFIHQAEDAIRLSLSGLDNDINQHVKWFESELKANDKVKIKVVEISQVAEVIKSEPCEERSIKNKLIEYRGLKRYLEKEGLIEKDTSDGRI